MSVRRYATYNMIGAVIPTLLALGTIPIYLHVLGQERFGALSAIWIICGSVGFFDLGLNRALSYAVAKAAGNRERSAPLVATALVIGSASATIAALLIYFAADWYFGSFFRAPAGVISEVRAAMPLVALTAITTVLLGIITGALQGNRSFLQANLFQTGMFASLQVGPLVCVVPSMNSIETIMLAVLVLRVLTICLGLRSIAKVLGVAALTQFRRREIAPILSFSKWTMGIAVVGPVILYCDKFLIGAMLGAAALALYNIPFQLAQRITLVPAAIGSAIFPDLVNLDNAGRSTKTARATAFISMVVTLPCFLLILLSATLLELWLGISPDLGLRVTTGFLILAFWINCSSQVYHTSLVTMNRPATVFRIMGGEVIVYLPFQYVAITHGGAVGAAVGFMVLCSVDALLMFKCSRLTNGGLKFIGLEFLILAAGIAVSIYASSSILVIAVAALVGGLAAVALRRQLLAELLLDLVARRQRDA